MEANNKLREALEALVDVIDKCDSGSPLWWHSGAKGVKPLKDARAALAAPPRNCDVGTVGQQDERFTAFCNRHFKAVGLCDKDCPCRDFNMIGGACSIVWAQMPYVEKEGGAK